ncbi:MAG TPA: hypothetical protein VHV47_08815, partial [Opitutaceae bacterium]|nr:hypothetical protein [Opitutaceae bacterium]
MSTAWRIVLLIAAFVVVFIFGGVIGGSTVVLFNRSHFEEVRAQRDKAQAERVLERQKEAAEAARQIALLRQQVSQLQQQGRGGMMMMIQHRGQVPPEQFGPHLMQIFANRLELTPDQQQQVHSLVFQTGEELRRLSRDTGHSSQIAIEHLEDQISTLLTPAQRDHFTEMIQRSREAFQHFNEQQQQWRSQQRLEQQGWRQGGHPGPGP